MEKLLLAALFAPLLGFVLLLLFGDYLKRPIVNAIGCLSVLLSFLLFSTLFWNFAMSSEDVLKVDLFNWIAIKEIKASFGLKLDHLSLLMSLIITGVGFLIHAYSIGYMEHDECISRYFACMNFFVFSMLLLVLSSNLLLLFAGWEGVGLASYLLIGFYSVRKSAAEAATKAFVVNRIGDAGFLLATIIAFTLFGTSDIESIGQNAASISQFWIDLFCSLLFLGAVGKSAQLPLQTWLPDAMEGPTPVSALIHAATMVTAGVYLVVRMHEAYLLSPLTLMIVGSIGAFTSLLAALSAVSQSDLKRVLAYSTISQLGLMFLACGVSGFYPAMFHLTTHAFTKALLFLSAGIVIHMMNGVTEMGKMGGLKEKFPFTSWMFLAGVLALSGIPPFAPFFSKDLILEEEHFSGPAVLFYVGLLASALTAFYMMRAYCLTFLGTSHVPEKIMKHVKEGPSVMRWPVFLLSLCTLFAGGLGFWYSGVPALMGYLSDLGITPVEKDLGAYFNLVLSKQLWLPLIGAFLGIGLAYYLFEKHQEMLKKPLLLFKTGFYFDDLYDCLIVDPLKMLSSFLNKTLEPFAFEGLVSRIKSFALDISRGMQEVQTGQIRSYLSWMAIGMAILIAYMSW